MMSIILSFLVRLEDSFSTVKIEITTKILVLSEKDFSFYVYDAS